MGVWVCVCGWRAQGRDGRVVPPWWKHTGGRGAGGWGRGTARGGAWRAGKWAGGYTKKKILPRASEEIQESRSLMWLF